MSSDHASAMRRLESALGRLEAEQARLRQHVHQFQGRMVELKTTVDRLEVNVVTFDGKLGTVRTGIDAVGTKSRQLASIMDGYLARQPAPPRLQWQAA